MAVLYYIWQPATLQCHSDANCLELLSTPQVEGTISNKIVLRSDTSCRFEGFHIICTLDQLGVFHEPLRWIIH